MGDSDPMRLTNASSADLPLNERHEALKTLKARPESSISYNNIII